MGRTYEASMKFNNKELAEKIISCQFRDPNYKGEAKQSSSNTYIDLAKLAGIRETILDQEGDSKLTEEELGFISQFWDWGKRCRCAHGCVDTTDDGYIIWVEGWNDCPTGILQYISSKTPDVVYEVSYWWEAWEDDDPGYDEGVIRNGICYNGIQEMNDSDIYNMGTELGEQGKYKEAIEMLAPVAQKGHAGANCNIGVCYEKLGDYEKAADYYSKSSDSVAKHNLLKLFDNNRLEYENDEYLSVCEELINRNDQIGYLYKSYILQNNQRGIEDKNAAFIILKEGMAKCRKINKLTFEMAYLLETGCGVESDQEKAHMLYKTLLGEHAVAEYNFALQCLSGRGCEKNVKLAVKWLKKSAAKNYHDAVKKLVEIYTNEEGFVDKKLADKFLKKLRKIEGE